MNFRNIFLTAACLFVAASVSAQGRQWTLRECIDYAIENNIGVRQTALQVENAEVNLNTTQSSRLPSLSAGIGQNFSFGRSISNDSNGYVDTQASNTSLSASANMTVFDGFRINNQVKADRLDVQAAMAGLERAKESVELNVTGYYLDVLYRREVAGVHRERAALMRKQVEDTQVMFDEGRVSRAQLLDIQSQLASAEVNEVTAANDFQMALLTLSQALNLPDAGGFDIVVPADRASDGTSDGTVGLDFVPLASPDAIYETAQGLRPSVRQAELSLESANHKVKVAKGGYWPSLSLGASFSDGYYYMFGSDVEQQDLADQLRNKHGENIGLNLSIPIFSQNRTRNSVRQAKLSAMNSQLELDAARQQLYKEIQQAWQTAVGAESRFRSASQALVAAEESFRAMEIRYREGKATAYEYSESGTQLAAARSEQAQARFNYLFSTRVLDFYVGRPIEI